MSNIIKRKGARKIAEIPADIMAAINLGEIETANLVESLAIDFSILLQNALSELPIIAINQMKQAEHLGWMDKTRTASKIIYKYLGRDILDKVINHSSDNVRGWGAGIIAEIPDLAINQRLEMVKPLANDDNAGTRETAWLLLRAKIAEDIFASIKIFEDWIGDDSANIRRYAIEATRPRGVWCKSIVILRENPSIGISLLDPLKSDPSRYVQNSVANWLNDAAKDHPSWVISLCEQWLADIDSKETKYICKRAMRNYPQKSSNN